MNTLTFYTCLLAAALRSKIHPAHFVGALLVALGLSGCIGPGADYVRRDAVAPSVEMLGGELRTYLERDETRGVGERKVLLSEIDMLTYIVSGDLDQPVPLPVPPQ